MQSSSLNEFQVFFATSTIPGPRGADASLLGSIQVAGGSASGRSMSGIPQTRRQRADPNARHVREDSIVARVALPERPKVISLRRNDEISANNAVFRVKRTQKPA